MKTLKPITQFALLAAALVLAQSAQADLVYNNGAPSSDLSTRFNPGGVEVGDEIILGGTYRLATNFTFQYWGENFSGGDETAVVRFYNNNGPTNSPGTVFWNSGSFTITATNRATLSFDLTSLNLVLPESFTWTVRFFGIDTGESAGVDVYDPPTTGNNYDDYWDHGVANNDWTLRTNVNSIPMSFGAQVSATVPEPGSLVLGLFGGLSLLALKLRSGRR
jgi:hypothetical protein